MSSLSLKRRGSNSLIAAVVLLTATGAFGTLATPALGNALHFKVRFEISTGKYMSSASCLPGCHNDFGIGAFSESDEGFNTWTEYKGLRIPRHGAAAAPGDPISIRASHWDLTHLGSWHWTESLTDGTTAANCDGLLFDTSQEGHHIFSAPKNTASELKLYIQSGELFQPREIFGAPCETDAARRAHAFYPAYFEPPGDGFLPDMLTAHVSIPLSGLRKLNVGGKREISLDQGKAKRLPPSDCTDATGASYTCTQSLHWTGAVTFERTG